MLENEEGFIYKCLGSNPLDFYLSLIKIYLIYLVRIVFIRNMGIVFSKY